MSYGDMYFVFTHIPQQICTYIVFIYIYSVYYLYIYIWGGRWHATREHIYTHSFTLLLAVAIVSHFLKRSRLMRGWHSAALFLTLLVVFACHLHEPRKSIWTKPCPLVGSGILHPWIILKTILCLVLDSQGEAYL